MRPLESITYVAAMGSWSLPGALDFASSGRYMAATLGGWVKAMPKALAAAEVVSDSTANSSLFFSAVESEASGLCGERATSCAPA